METKHKAIRSGASLIALAFAFAASGSAQMGGGMMGGRGGTAAGSMMGGSLGGMMGGSLAGMMGGGSGLAIGTDGTLYLTRSGPTQSQTSPTTLLSAIDTNGNSKWSLTINAPSASQPALGKDGTLFVTTSDWSSWMYDWMYDRQTPAAGTTANLLVVKPGTAAANVAVTMSLQGQMVSAPQIATDNAGSYIVYVVTVDAFGGSAAGTSATSGSYLYAFSPTGALKYKLQLSQGNLGMMGF